MKMRDDKGEDDKLIAVHADDPEYADYRDVTDMPAHRMRELKRFFQDYKELENKRVLVSEPRGTEGGAASAAGRHQALPAGEDEADRHGERRGEAEREARGEGGGEAAEREGWEVVLSSQS